MEAGEAATSQYRRSKYITAVIVGFVLTVILGILLSDQGAGRFVLPGVFVGVSSIASLNKQHLVSLLLFVGGAILFAHAAWDMEGWAQTVGWLAAIAGVVMWFVLRARAWRSADGAAGERTTGASSMETAEDEIHLSVTAGQVRRVITSQAFRGGVVSMTLGSLEIDLQGALLDENGASLSVSSRMATVTLRVPGDWVIELSGSQKLSKINDERAASPNEGPKLSLIINTSVGAFNITDR